MSLSRLSQTQNNIEKKHALVSEFMKAAREGRILLEACPVQNRCSRAFCAELEQIETTDLEAAKKNFEETTLMILAADLLALQQAPGRFLAFHLPEQAALEAVDQVLSTLQNEKQAKLLQEQLAHVHKTLLSLEDRIMDEVTEKGAALGELEAAHGLLELVLEDLVSALQEESLVAELEEEPLKDLVAGLRQSMTTLKDQTFPRPEKSEIKKAHLQKPTVD